MSSSGVITLPHEAVHHRLAAFIRANLDPIVDEWIRFAKTRTPASDNMSDRALRDHIVEILAFVADDLESPQTPQEQSDKSQGLGAQKDRIHQSAAEIHAALRLADGFNIDQMVSEYRALRASVVRLWMGPNQVMGTADFEDLTRFNEAIDQAVTESVAEYTKIINQSRDLFLAVLGHDLRNPIGAAWTSAQLLAQSPLGGEKQGLLAGQIAVTMERATHILNDLLELTRTTFGTEIPLVRTPMSMEELAKQLVEEQRVTSQGRQIELEVTGDTNGHWDRHRMGQVFSNLIGNAIQYSPEKTAVRLTVNGQGEQLIMSVHNEGSPIPVEKQKSIFESLTRATEDGAGGTGSANLGLGLFIAHKIVVAHGGTLNVHSTKEDGTTFTAILPKG